MTRLHRQLLAQLRAALVAGDDEGVVRALTVLRRTGRGRRCFHSLEKTELLQVLAACRRRDVATGARARAQAALVAG